MDAVDEYKLQVNRSYLVKNIQYCDIKDDLREHTINLKDDQDISSFSTDGDKIGKLLDLLPFRGPTAYKGFWNSLKDYSHVQIKLDDTDLKDFKSPDKDNTNEECGDEVGGGDNRLENAMEKLCVSPEGDSNSNSLLCKQRKENNNALQKFTEINYKTLSVVCKDRKCIENWKCIGRQLGVEEDQIYCIEEENKKIKEQCYQMLIEWQSIKGRGATVSTLVKILRNESCNKAADILDGILPP